MMDEGQPIIALQFHLSDSYTTGWGNSRANAYGVGGIPDVRIDGTYTYIGAASDSSCYNNYTNAMNARLGVYTDVSISPSYTKVGPQTYRVSADVSIEPGGVGKTMDIHIVQTRDYYPTSADDRYRDCVRNHGKQQITVAAGATETAQVDLNIGADAGLENIHFVVFAQEPGSGMNEIYNAAMIDVPESPAGDVDLDGDVDLADLGILLSAYGSSDGDPNWNPAADLNGDGTISLGDLNILLGNYGAGT